MVKIAVLIACHNRRETTIECLENLYHQKGINEIFEVETFLVDDASTDGTSLEVDQKFPQVNILQGSGDLFWNRGMHLAWEGASKFSFDAYLWLNDDTNLYKNALTLIIKAAVNTDFKSIICGSLEETPQSKVWSYGGGSIVNNDFHKNYPKGEIKPCEIINGNCVLVPNFVFMIVGNLDYTFIHCIGDNDYSLRAKKSGILSYTTGEFIGNCESHKDLPVWCRPESSLKVRIKSLYSPLGNSRPDLYFYFINQHYGLIKAIKSYFSIHLRLFIPSLWNK